MLSSTGAYAILKGTSLKRQTVFVVSASYRNGDLKGSGSYLQSGYSSVAPWVAVSRKLSFQARPTIGMIGAVSGQSALRTSAGEAAAHRLLLSHVEFERLAERR